MRPIELSKKLCLAGLVLAPLFATGSASADDVICQAERVRASGDRIDTRCVGVDRWFIAFRSSTDAQHLNQMLALLNSAVVAGKPLRLYYDLQADGSGTLWAVEMYP